MASIRVPIAALVCSSLRSTAAAERVVWFGSETGALEPRGAASIGVTDLLTRLLGEPR